MTLDKIDQELKAKQSIHEEDRKSEVENHKESDPQEIEKLDLEQSSQEKNSEKESEKSEDSDSDHFSSSSEEAKRQERKKLQTMNPKAFGEQGDDQNANLVEFKSKHSEAPPPDQPKQK